MSELLILLHERLQMIVNVRWEREVSCVGPYEGGDILLKGGGDIVVRGGG